MKKDRRIVKTMGRNEQSKSGNLSPPDMENRSTDNDLDYQDDLSIDAYYVSDEIPKGSDEFLSDGEIYSEEEDRGLIVVNDADDPSNVSRDRTGSDSDSEIQLNTGTSKTSEEDKFKQWAHDPAFEWYIQKMVAKEIQQSKTVKQKGRELTPQKVKSPSDTTIYMPALHKMQETPLGQVRGEIPRADNIPETEQIINNFIEGIRITTLSP